jgi:hypothetical protein
VFVGFHACINEMPGSRSKIPSKKSRPYIHDVKFGALVGAPYIYEISRLRAKGFIYLSSFFVIKSTFSSLSPTLHELLSSSRTFLIRIFLLYVRYSHNLLFSILTSFASLSCYYFNYYVLSSIFLSPFFIDLLLA